jgi:hypothetical protein
METEGSLLCLKEAVIEAYPEPIKCSPKQQMKTNSGALVRQRTIPTERPPLVSEVSANFRG